MWIFVLDRISFSICLLFPGFTLEPEHIEKSSLSDILGKLEVRFKTDCVFVEVERPLNPFLKVPYVMPQEPINQLFVFEELG